MRSVLNELAGLGYGQLVRSALARVETAPVDRSNQASVALSTFHGNSAEPAEAGAIREIEDLLDGSPASKAIVEEVYRRFVSVGGDQQSDLTAFLIAAADKKALPGRIITTLLSKAQDAIGRRNRVFMDTEYARILAHAMSEVPLASRSLVYRLIDSVVSEVTPLASSTAEIYTVLGRQHLDTATMFQRIVSQAKAAPPYQPQSLGAVPEPLPGISIVVGYGPWLEALAVLGTGRSLPSDAINVLEAHAGDPTLHDVIVRALVRQMAPVRRQCWKSSCSRVLEAFPQDAAQRQLAADLMAEQLAALPRNEFVTALERLRSERAAEVEPEVRIALGLAAINAQLARVRIKPAGDKLFE